MELAYVVTIVLDEKWVSTHKDYTPEYIRHITECRLSDALRYDLAYGKVTVEELKLPENLSLNVALNFLTAVKEKKDVVQVADMTAGEYRSGENTAPCPICGKTDKLVYILGFGVPMSARCTRCEITEADCTCLTTPGALCPFHHRDQR